MNTRKVVRIVVVVNTVFLAAVALGLLYWSQSAGAQAGNQSQDAAITAQAVGIPTYVSYQGVAYDATGKPLEGSHSLTFTLYSCGLSFPQTCSTEWTDTLALSLTKGLFNVRLGPLAPALFAPSKTGLMIQNRHLEVGTKIDGGTELTPRTPLNATAPWAFTSIYTENMPQPDYDSGWVNSPGGMLCGGYELTHDLGEAIDDYVVQLDCRRDDTGTYGCVRNAVDAMWWSLTTTKVQVDPCVATQDELDFRVRIWVTR